MHNNSKVKPGAGRGVLTAYMRTLGDDKPKVKNEVDKNEEYNLGFPELPNCVHEGIVMAPPDVEECEGIPSIRKNQLNVSLSKKTMILNCDVEDMECDGILYTYITPATSDIAYGLDCLAKHLKNLNELRIVIVCEVENEAKELKQELAIRNVATTSLQTDANEKATQNLLQIWKEGYINQAIIISDDMLPRFGYNKVNCLVHYMLPSNEVFQRRFALTKGVGQNLKIIVLRSVTCTGEYLFLDSNYDDKKIPNHSNPIQTNDLVRILTKTVPQQEISAANFDLSMHNIASSSNTKKNKNTMINKLPERVPLVTQERAIKTSAVKNDSSEKRNEKYNVFDNDILCYIKYGVFAHTRVPQVPCYDIKCLRVESGIKRAMEKLKFERAFRLQRFAWPHTLPGHSLIVVGPEGTGKTWSYLPILCQRTYVHIKNRQDKNDPYAFGPCSVIIVSCVTKGEQIVAWCRELLDFCKLDVDIIVDLFERCNALEARSRMHQPCGILITTLSQFDQLWNCNDRIVDIFNELKTGYIAIDDIDEIWRSAGAQCTRLLQRLFSRFHFEAGQAQLFITARCWPTEVLLNALSNLPDYLLAFEDALELAVYAGIKLELQTISEQNPATDNALIKMLQQTDLKQERILMVCRDMTEALALGVRLKFNGIKHFIHMDECDNQKPIIEWQVHRTASVLITTDDYMQYLQCGPITRLIHYSMASSWSRFKARFILFYDKFCTMSNTPICSIPELTAAAAKICHLPASTVITVREGDIDSLWKFCDFMLRHEFDVPEVWLAALFRFKLMHDQVRQDVDVPFCQQVGAFGNCCRRNCRFRHFIWDYECLPQTQLTPNTEIQFQMISMYTPAQLAVRLTNHPTENFFLGYPITKYCMEIQLHYEQSSNRRPHGPALVGDICIMKYKQRYERVAVTRTDKDIRVQTKILDSGTEFVMVDMTLLFLCEERFKYHPFEARELRMTGVAPSNMDRIWSEESKRLVRKMFFPKDLNQIFKAKVDFTFYDTIFVSNVYNSKGQNLKSFIDQHLLVLMDAHVEKRLLQVMAAAKVCDKPKRDHRVIRQSVAPNKVELKKEMPTKTTIEVNNNCKIGCWRQVPLNKLMEIELVNPQFMVLVDEVILKKRMVLQHMINGHLSLCRRYCERPQPQVLKDEQHFLYPQTKKFQCRVRIMNTNTGGKKLFLLDYGIQVDFIPGTTDKLLSPTAAELLTYNPYEAMHIRFAGIVLKETSAEAYKALTGPCEGLFAYTIRELTHPANGIFEKLSFKSYEILLYKSKKFDLNAIKNGVFMNDKMVELGLARYDPKTKHLLKIYRANAEEQYNPKPNRSSYQELIASANNGLQSKEKLSNREFFDALTVPRWSDKNPEMSSDLDDYSEVYMTPEYPSESELEPEPLQIESLFPKHISKLQRQAESNSMLHSEPQSQAVDEPKRLPQTQSQPVVSESEPTPQSQPLNKLEPMQEPEQVSESQAVEELKSLPQTESQQVVSETKSKELAVSELKLESQSMTPLKSIDGPELQSQPVSETGPEPLSESQSLLEEEEDNSTEPSTSSQSLEVNDIQCSRPTVSWYDTPKQVFVSIAATNVTEYKLVVVGRLMSYMAPETCKSFDIILFGTVVSFKHEIRGLNVVVTLIKPFCVPWPRLCSEKYRTPWLHYDLSKFDMQEQDAGDMTLIQIEDSTQDNNEVTEPDQDINSKFDEYYDVYENLYIKDDDFADNA